MGRVQQGLREGLQNLAKSERPTAIVMKNTKFTSVSGSNVYLGEGDEWLQCVVKNSGPPANDDDAHPLSMFAFDDSDFDDIPTPATPPIRLSPMRLS